MSAGHGNDCEIEIDQKEINGRLYRVIFDSDAKTYTIYKDYDRRSELVQRKMNGHELAHCLLKVAEEEVIAAFKMVAE